MTLLAFHVAAGATALVAGYVALYATKGATVHRKSGMLFTVAMAAMSLSGAWIAANQQGISVNAVAGLLTFYFVATALTTVRRGQDRTSRWIDTAAMLGAVFLGALAFKVGVESLHRGRPEAIPMFVFGTVALLAAMGDLRLLRGQDVAGSRRIKRHLWRMCFGMWIAAASFFWGPPRRVPELLRIPALLPIPVLAPIAVMLVWLWRLRAREVSKNA